MVANVVGDEKVMYDTG